MSVYTCVNVLYTQEIQGAKEVVLPSGVRYTDVIVGGGQRYVFLLCA